MDVVELRQAWCFTCEDCGRDNFVRPVVYTASSPLCFGCGHDEDDHASEGQGRSRRPCEAANCDCQDLMLEDGANEWITVPGEVTCEHCGSRFKAVEV